MDRAVTHLASSRGAALQAVPPAAVELLPGLWHDRCAANRATGLPRLLERLERHGVLDNFRRRAGTPGAPAERRGFWFTDSDLAKWMEAAAWSLGSHPDDGLAADLDRAVDVVLAAQEPDGYLSTAFEGGERFAHLGWSHELYCAGHLIQAAVARRRATGRDDLLGAAVRFADLLAREFGPGRREEADAHPGVETALVELARETSTARYLDLASFLLDRVDAALGGEMWGHAVRALYHATGVADVALETADAARDADGAARWASMTGAKSYVTGGVGGRWIGESVGRRFELPGEGAYAETCAGVGVVQWAWRLLARTGDARFADQLELALYNAFLAGVSLGGDEWFYANPLAASGEPEHDPWATDRVAEEMAGPFPLQRRPWREVTCCPPNAGRMLASLPGYLYGTDGRGLWVHLYAASRVRAAGFDATVDTRMPWDGRVTVRVDAAPAGEASLFLRVPGWCRAATLTVQGAPHPAGAGDGARYVEVRRTWAAGDRVVLDLALDPQEVVCDPRVAEYRGSVAVRRGPLVYCIEGVDHPGVDARTVALAPGRLVPEHRPELLGGVTVLHGRGVVAAEPWGEVLYRPPRPAGPAREVAVTAVPYFAWANRGPGTMAVWLPRA